VFYRDDDTRCRERSDSRVERGYPPLTPVACMRDSILSAVFDDLMSKVTLIVTHMLIIPRRHSQYMGYDD